MNERELQISAKYMADNNKYQYGKWSGAGNNTAANPSDGWHYDCGTGLTWVIRDAKNGHKHDNSPLSWYIWPNNDGSSYFDNYLLNNGFTRYRFDKAKALASGYHFIPVVGRYHVWAWYDVTQDLQFELNDGYGSGNKSVDIHKTVYYSDALYMYFPTGWEKGGIQIKEGLQNDPEPDGRYAYYTKGKIDTSVSGVYENASGWWFVKDGYVATYYWGLAQNKYGWWVCEAGKVNFNAKTGFYGLAISDTEWGWFWCEGGKLQEDKNDIVQDPYDGQWRYIRKGRWIEDFNGIAANKNGVWRVVNGVVDFTEGEFDVKIKTNSDGMVIL